MIEKHRLSLHLGSQQESRQSELGIQHETIKGDANVKQPDAEQNDPVLESHEICDECYGIPGPLDVLLGLIFAYLEVVAYLTEIALLNSVYNQLIQNVHDGVENQELKWFFVVFSCLQFIDVFVSYQTGNYQKFARENYGRDSSFKDLDCCQRISFLSKFVFLTPILKYLLLRFVNLLLQVLMTVPAVLAVCFGKVVLHKYVHFSQNTIRRLFDTEPQELEQLLNQRKMFAFLHVEVWQLLMKLLAFFGVLFEFPKEGEPPEITNEMNWFESTNAYIQTFFLDPRVSLSVSIILSIISFCLMIYQLFNESYYLHENTLIYTLNSIRGKIDWIPFSDRLENLKPGEILDYCDINIQYPFGISQKTGLQSTFRHRFNEQSGSAFAHKFKEIQDKKGLQSALQQNQTEKGSTEAEDQPANENFSAKAILKLNRSFSGLQAQTLFEIIELIDMDTIEINLDLDIKNLIQKSISMNKLKDYKQNPPADKTIRQNFECTSGTPVLAICAQTELSDSNRVSPSELQFRTYLHNIMQILLSDYKVNVDREIPKKGETILFNSIVNEYIESAKKLIQHSQNLTQLGENGMSALSSALIAGNAEIFDILTDNEEVKQSFGACKIYERKAQSLVGQTEAIYYALQKLFILADHTKTGDHKQIQGSVIEMFKIFDTIIEKNMFKKSNRLMNYVSKIFLQTFHFEGEVFDKTEAILSQFLRDQDNGVFDLRRRCPINGWSWLNSGMQAQLWKDQKTNFFKYKAKMQSKNIDFDEMLVAGLITRNSKQEYDLNYIWGQSSQSFSQFMDDQMMSSIAEMRESGRYHSMDHMIEVLGAQGEEEGRAREESGVKTATDRQSGTKTDLEILEDNYQPCTEVEPETVCNFLDFIIYLLELAAVFDFVGDIIVAQQVFASHPSWFTIILFTMICPFYICYIPLLNFQVTELMLSINEQKQLSNENNESDPDQTQVKRQNQKQELSIGQKTLVYFSMSLPIILFLMIMDVVFNLQAVILAPIAYLVQILMKCCCKKNTRLNFIDMAQDYLNKALFGLTKVESQGFRKLRTLSQLLFESIPQIVLQMRIYMYLKDSECDDEEDAGTCLNLQGGFKVDEKELVFSLVFAFVHIFLEVLILFIESSLYMHRLVDYFFICLNGRLGWVPFVHLMRNQTFNNEHEYNYGKIEHRLGNCLPLVAEFKFSNQTAVNLSTFFRTNMEQKEKTEQDKLGKLKFGGSLNDVTFWTLIDLQESCYMKAKLEVPCEVVKSLMNGDKARQAISKLEANRKGGELFQRLQFFDCSHILRHLWQEYDLNFQGDPREDTLFQRALAQKKFNTIVELMYCGYNWRKTIGRTLDIVHLRNMLLDSTCHDKKVVQDHLNELRIVNIPAEEGFWPGGDGGLLGWGFTTGWGMRITKGSHVSINFDKKAIRVFTAYVRSIAFNQDDKVAYGTFERRMAEYYGMIDAFNEVLKVVKNKFRTELDYEASLCACGFFVYVYKDDDVTELLGPNHGPKVDTNWNGNFENDEDKWGK